MKIVDLTEEQADVIENKLEAYDEDHISYKLDGLIRIGRENYDVFRAIHSRMDGGMYWNSDRMLDALNKAPDALPEQVLAGVMDGINEFVADAEQFDDITMLCIRYNGDNPIP